MTIGSTLRQLSIVINKKVTTFSKKNVITLKIRVIVIIYIKELIITVTVQ